MIKAISSLIAALSAAALAGAAAQAQDGPAEPGAVVGHPQLKDFSLEPRERIVVQPEAEPAGTEPADAAPPARQETQRSATREPAPSPPRPAPERRAQAEPAAPPPVAREVEMVEAAPAEPGVSPEASVVSAEASPVADAADPPAPALPPAQADAEQPGFWLFALPAAALALLGAAYVGRRRRAIAAPAGAAIPGAASATPVPPKPEPVLRPWIEFELKAKRTAVGEEEATVWFDLVIRNAGQAPARNLRIGARLFNAGVDQDKEIGSYFRTGSEERKTFTIPDIPAGEEGEIRGSVAMKRDEVRPISVQGRPLFIPMLAVNAFYDWGENGSGQTGRSYVIGREPKQPAEKMGPFRLDLGPRIWSTVGQRPHRMAKRV